MNKNNVITGIAGVIVGLVIGFLSFAPSPEESALGMSNTEHNNMAEMSPEDHHHGAIEIGDGIPLPGVEIEAIKDEKDGFNIHVVTENYTFTPESVNLDPVANHGHAHIFVNGQKVSRLYGDWYHLSDDKLKEGENIIEVTLNANDHSDWVIDGQHVSSLVKVIK